MDNTAVPQTIIAPTPVAKQASSQKILIVFFGLLMFVIGAAVSALFFTFFKPVAAPEIKTEALPTPSLVPGVTGMKEYNFTSLDISLPANWTVDESFTASPQQNVEARFISPSDKVDAKPSTFSIRVGATIESYLDVNIVEEMPKTTFFVDKKMADTKEGGIKKPGEGYAWASIVDLGNGMTAVFLMTAPDISQRATLSQEYLKILQTVKFKGI